jgi:hypothetical protein
MRQVSDNFLNDLKEGLLKPILMQVKQDDTLMLALREDYINIYYRGGNLLRISANDTNDTGRTYRAFFDPEYDKTREHLPDLSGIELLGKPLDAQAWVEAFPALKQAMDFHFSESNKPEREFQQLVARENNRSPISNESEYFVTDIEFADSDIGARFDMLAVRWPASARKDGSNCRATLIEMKYGDNALDGSSGLVKHLRDIESLLKDGARRRSLLGMIAAQFSQLDELDLLRFNRSVNGTKIVLDAAGIPEVVFLLANHNPRSSKLERILKTPEMDKYAQSRLFDLRFFVASFAGYGMHSDCMLTLQEFRTLIGSATGAGKVAL